MTLEPLELTAIACQQCGTVTLYAQGRQIDGPRSCPACHGPLDAGAAERYSVRLAVREAERE